MILYLSVILPSLSETFVYNELFGLREKGNRVVAASVHPPASNLDDSRLVDLAKDIVPVYGSGPAKLGGDAFAECVRHPIRTGSTLSLGLYDIVFSRDIQFPRRFKVLWQLLAAMALARRVRRFGITHIHAHMAHVPTTVAMYAARQLGISFSFTGHANDLFPQRTLLKEKLKRATFVACISHWHRDFYKSIVNLPDDRLPIVRCGVEIPELKSRQSNSKENCSIVAVGRLVPKKGFDLLLRAVANLAVGGKRVTCRIIGDGPQRSELEALADSLKITERVHFLGTQTNAEVKMLLPAADLFVLPCRIDSNGDRDGIPVALMEAMAARVCVISGDLPTIRELVKNEETGLLVPPGDVEALSDAIGRVLNNPELRNRLAEAGRAWVNAEFSREVNIGRLMKALGISEIAQ